MTDNTELTEGLYYDTAREQRVIIREASLDPRTVMVVPEGELGDATGNMEAVLGRIGRDEAKRRLTPIDKGFGSDMNLETESGKVVWRSGDTDDSGNVNHENHRISRNDSDESDGTPDKYTPDADDSPPWDNNHHRINPDNTPCPSDPLADARDKLAVDLSEWR